MPSISGPTRSRSAAERRLADTAKVLSRYVDGIMARVYSHEDLVEMSRHATVPVINGLSDLLHPVQALADFFTLLERRGRLDGVTLAYVGDGNNMCHGLMSGAVKLGVAMKVAAPSGYEPNQLIVKSAVREAQKVKTAPPVVTADPMEAVQGADVVYTDVWTSMGQEAEAEARRQAFQGYMVTPEMMAAAAPDAVFMHCLPAHRGEEVAAEVIDGPQSIVFDQVENRLHVQKAILILLMGGDGHAGEAHHAAGLIAPPRLSAGGARAPVAARARRARPGSLPSSRRARW